MVMFSWDPHPDRRGHPADSLGFADV